MRAALSMSLGVLLVAAACGSSNGSTTTTGSGGAGSTTSGGGSTTGGALLAAGKPCKSDGACQSGVCGVNGSGNCCSAACNTSDATCAASACDATGACSYPSSTVTCGTTCVGATLTIETCDGVGNCHPGSGGTACPGNFDCGATGCKTSCTSIADCATGFACNAGACVQPFDKGSCTENDDCTSGVCGLGGTGNCCLAACATTDAVCGATGCDATSAACIYPDPTVKCGDAGSICSLGTETDQPSCNGLGACGTPPTVQCAPFLCGADACLTSCTDASSCAAGDFCDTANAKCCGTLIGGTTLAVDAVAGSDTQPCCGFGGALPCLTLTHAMALIDASGALSVQIVATVDGGGGDWSTAFENYPVVLGSGVEVSAPGVFFTDPGENASVFEVAGDGGLATIVGDGVNPVSIGFDSLGIQANDPNTVMIDPGGTFYVANAAINGNASLQSNAIWVSGGGTLVVGQDPGQEVTGPVAIGNNNADPTTDGFNGIVCGTDNGLGCTISDAPLKGSALVIQGQEGMDIDAEDNADITLSSSPQIGQLPDKLGFHTCGNKIDASGTNGPAVLLNGLASMTFDNGSVTCISGEAFRLQATAAGGPTLIMDSASIQGTEAGIHALAGTATVSNSNVWYNYNGVEQDTDGVNNAKLDLSGGGNVLVCSNGAESALSKGGKGEPPGVSALNTTSDDLNASNVAWDTATPDEFMCDATLTNCTCQSGTCAVDAGDQGMDAVYESTGTVTTTGNTLSTEDCSLDQGAPACGPGHPCPPGQICCQPIFGGGNAFCGQVCPG